MALDTTTTTQDVELLIPSMTCAGCMRKVEGGLLDTPGVVSARVNLTAHSVRIRFDALVTSAEGLIDALQHLGYAARPIAETEAARGDAPGRALLLKTGVAGFAAMNVMLLSISVWSGAEGATRDLLHWVSAMIALPAMAYAGTPFFTSAFAALRAGRLNMDVPISLALILSGASSIFETSQGGQHAFFDAGIMLVFFLLIGRVLEHQTRKRARSAAAELMEMTGRFATLIQADGSTQQITVEALRPGMELMIAAGDRVPADGVILSGRTDLDRALITGESQPVPATTGDVLHAGTTNLSGPIRVRLTRTGEDSLLGEIASLVTAAEAGKGRYDQIADRVARLYAPVVHILAGLALGGWLLATGDARLSVQIAVAVLIITCPCALALAVPTVHTVATGRLFRQGIFLKDGAALERLAEVDTIVFDKTGTLTDGKPTLVSGPNADDTAWPIAMALTNGSRHPFSEAIAAEAARLGIVVAPLTEVTELPGMGMFGLLDGEQVKLGRPEWIAPDLDADVAMLLPGGRIVCFGFAETLRPRARAVCDGLRQAGYQMRILSGDDRRAVEKIADATGIEQFRSHLIPTDKHRHLKDLAQQGRKVLMVGDGLNDNPALAAAHASMSPSAALDATQNVADLVFTGDGIEAVADALAIAKTARARSFESFGIAAVYNVIAIPLAFAGLVTPLIAALAMSGSSILVILNALRLRRQT